MGVARFVVLRGPAGQPRRKCPRIEGVGDIPAHDLLNEIQQGAPVPVGHFQ